MDRARVRAYQAEQRRIRHAVVAIVVAFAGVLAIVAAEPDSRIGTVLFLGPGLIAAGILGNVRATFAGPPRLSDVAWGAGGAVAMLAIGIGYVVVLGADPPHGWRVLAAPALLTIAVLPALVEEWVCRGVLWEACMRLASERTTIMVTALLFGLMHVLTWGLLNVPVHILAGVVLGFVRARTGSLGPGIVAHLLYNTVVAGYLV